MSDPFLDKPLPQNLDAERAVLGAILLDNSVCDQAVVLLNPDDFFLDSDRTLFKRMTALRARGDRIDLITLGDELRIHSEFEKVGGATYIASLIDGVPRTDNIEPYAKLIKNKSALRRIIAVSSDAAVCALDADDPVEVQERLIQALTEIEGTPRPPRFELIDDSELDRLPEAKFLPGTRIVEGGLQMWVGLTETGKSNSALRDSYHLSRLGPVVYVSAEGAIGLKKRRDAIIEHYGIVPGEITFITEPVNLLDAKEVSQFISICKSKYPDGVLLVVFDTKSQCSAGGEENSSRDDSLQVAHSNRIRRELGCAELLLHHSDKLDTTARGSGATHNACDCVLYFKRDGDFVTVSVQHPRGKLRDGERWPDEVFRFVKAADSVVLEPVDKIATEYSPIDATDKKILQALLSVGATGSSPTQLVRLTEIPERSLYDRLRKLRDSIPALVFVEYCKKPRRSTYFITYAGCKLLQKPDKTTHSDKSNDKSELVDSTAELQEYCKSTASEADCTAARLSLLREPQPAVRTQATKQPKEEALL